MRHNSIVYSKAKIFSRRIYFLKNCLRAKHEYELADQIFRSGTSVGANIAEANDAYTRKDFHHKLTIALKECSETKYWLELLLDVNLIAQDEFESLYQDCMELYRMLSSICKTLKTSSDNPDLN